MDNLYQGAKKSAKRRLEKGRIDAGKVDITKDYLIELYNKQNGKCFYSGIDMIYILNNEFKISIDRIDNEKGYIKGNIVLCCLEFNNSTKWTNEKIIEMYKLTNEKHNMDELELEIKRNINEYNPNGRIVKRIEKKI
jgi:hypothetical protein